MPAVASELLPTHLLEGVVEQTEARRAHFAMAKRRGSDGSSPEVRTPLGPGNIPRTPFLRWDEKAGLRRDAIRSQCSTCSRHKEKETGYEKDYHCTGIQERNSQGAKADDRFGFGR